MATVFTPVSALAGGMLIGASSAGFYLVNGRIAGISSLVRDALHRREGLRALESLAFLVGIVLAPLLWTATLGAPPVQTSAAGDAVVLTAGLLTGLGTTFANGCTSGHGVCGLARLSLRSFVAVLIFMGAAAATVYVTRHAAVRLM